MFTGIMCEPPTDNPACGITWKMCIRERWDPDWPYDIVAKGCHMWPVRGRAYVMLVTFIPLSGLLLIRIFTTLSDMNDSLLTAPTHRNACFILWWWIKRWLIINNYYYDIFTSIYDCLLECSSFRLHLYSCIINMVKLCKINYWK
jgi:hypothetical protein